MSGDGPRDVTPRSYGVLMDTATPASLTEEPAPHEAVPSSRRARRALTPGPEQPPLPLPGDAVDEAAELPNTGDHDRPIGFALTARARRVVAPDSLPDLAVVPARPVTPDGEADAPGDTRPARARALRRAGVPAATIAAQLDADPLLVTAWTGEVGVHAHRRSGTGGDVAPPGAPALGQEQTAMASDDHEQETARALARAEAAQQARARLAVDPMAAVGLGLLAAVAEVDAHAVTVTSDDVRIVRRALQSLMGERPEARDLARVVVRVGPGAAGDLVRHRTAATLGLDVSQVTWTRWRTPPRPDAVRTLLRVADPGLADDVAGMVEAVLDPSPRPGEHDF